MLRKTLIAPILLAAMLALPARADNTLIVAAPQTPTGMDGDIAKVATRQMVVQNYDGLVTYHRVTQPDGSIKLDATSVEPMLAESWTVSPDGKVYRFKLKQGLRSGFGNELTSDDLQWSWDRAWAIKRTTQFLYGLLGVESWKIVSRYEFEISLKAPSHIFLQMLTMYFPMICDATEVKKHATAEDPWGLKFIDQNLAGFGAYTVASLKPGEQVVLQANPNYWRGKPFYDRVIYREVPSASNRLALLKTGQVQWVEDLPLKQIADLKRDPSVKVESVIGTQPATVRMNAHIKPFDDLRVRQAMAYATDYDAMHQSVFEGLGTRVTSMVSPGIPGKIDASTISRDVAKAKALLAEAGYKDGIDVTINYGGTYWWMEPVAIQLRNQWAEAGIRLTLQRLPDPEFIARGLIQRRDMALFPAGDASFVLDPIFELWIFGYSKGTANRTGFDAPEFERLLPLALNEPDTAKRLEMAAQLQHIQADAVDWIMLDYPGIHQVMAKCMKGWIWHPDDWPRFADLRCER